MSLPGVNFITGKGGGNFPFIFTSNHFNSKNSKLNTVNLEMNMMTHLGGYNKKNNYQYRNWKRETLLDSAHENMVPFSTTFLIGGYVGSKSQKENAHRTRMQVSIKDFVLDKLGLDIMDIMGIENTFQNVSKPNCYQNVSKPTSFVLNTIDSNGVKNHFTKVLPNDIKNIECNRTSSTLLYLSNKDSLLGPKVKQSYADVTKTRVQSDIVSNQVKNSPPSKIKQTTLFNITSGIFHCKNKNSHNKSIINCQELTKVKSKPNHCKNINSGLNSKKPNTMDITMCEMLCTNTYTGNEFSCPNGKNLILEKKNENIPTEQFNTPNEISHFNCDRKTFENLSTEIKNKIYPINNCDIGSDQDIFNSSIQKCDIRMRAASECSIDSEDSFVIFTCDSDYNVGSSFEEECDGWRITDNKDSSLNTVSRPSCSVEKNETKINKKVTFAAEKSLVKVHRMVVWDYAYRMARTGPWEVYARDSARFMNRIGQIATVLNPILNSNHRQKNL
uniref:Uncharacterized protein n=1 Tax=Clastoptera arizonana TaxID=38151 RepID=A0A1B6DLP0_9HEMI